MKKFLLTLLALIMALSCIGCGNSSTNPQESESTGTQKPTEEITTATPEPEVPALPVVYYDDYFESIEGISASDEELEISSNALETVTLGRTKMFHAVGTGNVTLKSGDLEVEFVIEKAKLNLIVIMGQSNSGNHFANATSDITCPKGTAYWWGNGQGTAATAPVDFTHATKGFHSPLLAELYAQSVAHGNPTKNVLIWHEGGNQNGEGTSKNGSSIYGWATSAKESSGTNYTVQMVKNCVAYYEENSDKYTIVSKGVYWLQGEGDGVRGIDPKEYSDCFMAMWNKLKAQAGLEYMAIMRVRKGGDMNTLNNDIDYSTTVSAQFALANKHADIFIATTITENFTGAPTQEIYIDISNYITLMETYGGKGAYQDSYGNKAKCDADILITTMSTLFGSNNKNHYGKFGYALIAADAAYNMYNALHGESYAFTQATSSGKPEEQTLSFTDDTVELDISKLTGDLAFRAACGSVAGTLSICVTSNGEAIPSASGVINTKGANYACVNVENLKKFENVVITLTYETLNWNVGCVTYVIKNGN